MKPTLLEGPPARLRDLLLWPLGALYAFGAARRNAAFDAGRREVHRLSVPVVSVGNLSVGGTGKTPTVAWLCELARAHGRRPGVCARGYGRAEGARLNDEGTMLQAQLPWLLQEQDPDRVAAGQRLVQQGADFIVLDDGFQHRRLHRDVDLVCVDARAPFGNGYCLPAGELRERPHGLRRAQLVLATRADGLQWEAVQLLTRRLREVAGNATLPVFACEHAPRDVVQQPVGTVLPLTELRGRRAWLLSAIARPASFRTTVAALGAVVVGEHRYRDHHDFTADEVDAAARQARAHDAVVLTTQKDDARLQPFALERLVLRIGLRFLGDEPALKIVGLS